MMARRNFASLALGIWLSGCSARHPLPLDLQRSKDNLGASPKLQEAIDDAEKKCVEGLHIRVGTCAVDGTDYFWFIRRGRRTAYRVKDGVLVYVESSQKGADTSCAVPLWASGPARYGEEPRCTPTATAPCEEMDALLR